MNFHVTLEQAEDGWIVVECPALPGCVSQGADEREGSPYKSMQVDFYQGVTEIGITNKNRQVNAA